jgi:general secretion pathway protein D
LNAKVTHIVQCLSVVITLSALPSFAVGGTHTGYLPVVTSAWSQLGFSGSDTKKQADDLLKQARAALQQQKIADAEALVAKAEKLGVKYDALTARFFDSPEKVRKDIAAAKANAPAPKATSVAMPALLNAPKSDVPPPAMPASPPQKTEAMLSTLTNDSKAKAKLALDQGRTALAQGNVPEAEAAYRKAISFNAAFAASEYSPAQLAAELKQKGSLSQTPPSGTANSPFMLRPGDLEAEDKLTRLPEAKNSQPMQRAESAFGAPMTNPNNMPAQTGTLAGGDFQPSGNAAPTQRLPGVSGDNNVAAAKAEVLRLTSQAKAAQDRGDLQSAARFIDQAQRLNVPESAFAQGETRPWQVMLEINKEMVRRQGVQPAAANISDNTGGNYQVAPGVYNPTADNSRVMQVQSENAVTPLGNNEAERIIAEANRALEMQDRETAVKLYQQAWKYADQLDPNTRQQLKDKLAYLRVVPNTLPNPAEATGIEAPLDAEARDRVQKLWKEMSSEITNAEKLANQSPNDALANLKQLRDRIDASEVDAASKRSMQVMVDRKTNELETYIERNRSDIELREKNESVKDDLNRERQLKSETENKVAQLVEQFNKLLDEGRYAEAEVIAKQVRELMPNTSIAENVTWKSRFAKNLANQKSIEEMKNNGFLEAMEQVDRSSVAYNDNIPLQFGNAKEWTTLTNSRRRMMEEFTRKRSPAEMEIERSLSKMVEANFKDRPLEEVLDTLSKMAGINVHLDPTGLHAEAVTPQTPVSLNMNQPISLKSALNLILGQYNLSYIIENEVLVITSKDARDSHVYTKVYYVADLVTPIPNFVPSYNIGLPGAIRESFNAMGYNNFSRGAGMGPIPLTINQNEGSNEMSQNPSVMAQLGNANMQMQGKDGSSMPLPMPSAGRQPLGYGPGGLGGGVVADFDTLIELMTSTITPDSWIDNGGKGTISGFPTNLSLVVSQTQDIHQDIADLLQQLRRLQDLQVTIEVRFIALNDNFFERMGVKFDFNIDDNSGIQNLVNGNSVPDDDGRSFAFGTSVPTGTNIGQPQSDGDFTYRTGILDSVVPQFGSPDLGNAASMGFAILSDIEVFFFLSALNGDTRTNVLQAPKVTLFNGQQAFVRDSTDRPFVTQIIPVVGDFAAAHQPVITVLSEGTSLSVQAVVSADRRFVRLTLVPYFTKIGDVSTFTFNGRTTSNTGTTVVDPTDPTKTVQQGSSTTTEGSTVQLPSLAVTTVSTTVSVPDGGTILLGGVKRLSEGRVERGVPLVGKLPYVSRLFRNTAIGRSTQSLMLMVTPRIIIQEEEEEKLGLGAIQ